MPGSGRQPLPTAASGASRVHAVGASKSIVEDPQAGALDEQTTGVEHVLNRSVVNSLKDGVIAKARPHICVIKIDAHRQSSTGCAMLTRIFVKKKNLTS